MADETPVTPTATPAAPAPQPDEGLLHELATSAGLDPEAIVATAKAIRQHPWQVAKEVGSAQAGEFVDAGHHLRDTALSALNGVASAITNPEAKATAIARLKSPGIINKIQGAEEYATAAVPLVGGNYVKAEEQAGRGNIAGSIGTTLGTTLPLVTDTEGAEGIKAHLAETGKTFVDSAKEGLRRAAVATAPEGSAEAGFAKIPGSKKVRGATPKPTEPVEPTEDKLAAVPGAKFVGKTPAPPLYSKEGAQPLADHIGAQVVGSVATKGASTHDLDLKVDNYDQAAVEAAMKEKGFEPVGSSILSPKEIKASGKDFGTAADEWARAHHFESTAEPHQKVDVWHKEPAEPVSAPAETAPAAEYHPDLQKVIDLPGVKVHTDPKQVTEAAHFVTPDGKFVRLPAGMDHPDAIIAAGAKHENEGLSQQPFTVPPFLNDTGTIRIRPTQDANGTTLHVNVPVAGVSSKQVEALKQAVGQGLKSQGHLMLETADNPRDIKTEYKDFARSSDVEPMLRTIGAHPDQTGTLPKEVTPIQLKKVDKSEASEAGYVYHATSEDRAHDIAQDGLKTHKPNAFTDQTTWPDGATEKRNYFTKTAEHTWQFAPEDGKPVLIRTKPSANFKTESTGDVYTKKVIKPEAIEILGEDNNWHPITSLKRPAK